MEDRFGTLLGPVLGPSWARLGPSWGHLGAILGPSWAISGPSWAILGQLAAISGYLALDLHYIGVPEGRIQEEMCKNKKENTCFRFFAYVEVS